VSFWLICVSIRVESIIGDIRSVYGIRIIWQDIYCQEIAKNIIDCSALLMTRRLLSGMLESDKVSVSEAARLTDKATR
jgi:hypothetical protein